MRRLLVLLLPYFCLVTPPPSRLCAILLVTLGLVVFALRSAPVRGTPRNTDLFAKMAAAASMTEARIAHEDGHQQKRPEAEKASSTAPARDHSSRNGAGSAAAAVTGKGQTGEIYPGGGSGGREAGGEETSEFARMAQTLREQAEKNGGVSGEGAKPAAAAMDVDSDEEETMTLEGEFKAAPGGAKEGAKVVAEGRNGVVKVKGGQKEEAGPRREDDGEEEDLLSAVKKGKGRGRGKGKAKGKRGEA